MNEIEIFRTGTHTAVSGEKIAFTDADLAAIAAAYDPSKHEAPAVVGHPQETAPAYGWVKGLKVKGDRLVAEFDQVDPAFAELVNSGRFKKISPSFYPPDADYNPVKGQMYLQHVGFLGAKPPAVKGLKPAEFAETERLLTFGEIDNRVLVSLLRSLRDWIVASSGVEKADDVLSQADLDYLADQAAQPDAPQIDGDVMTQPSFAEKEAALAAERTKLENERAAFAERQAALTKKENEEFLDTLIKDGKFLPAMKAGALLFMERLAAGKASEPLEFAEGEQAVKVTSALAYFKDFLGRATKAVTFGEAAAHQDAGARPIRFTFAPGSRVDRGRLDLHEKALAYMDANKGVDFVAACKAVGVP